MTISALLMQDVHYTVHIDFKYALVFKYLQVFL